MIYVIELPKAKFVEEISLVRFNFASKKRYHSDKS